MPADLFNAHKSRFLKKKELKLKADTLLKKEGNKSNINVIFTSDNEIKKLNNKFRKHNTSTDVLSFNFNDEDLLGEIYISIDTTRKQAIEHKVKFYDEVWRLMVHGIFHLLGYTHGQKKDMLKMEQKEGQYLG